MKYFVFLFILLALTGCTEDEAKERIKEKFVDYAEPLEETTSKPSDPARVLPDNPSGCPSWGRGRLNMITESMLLPEGCKYDRVRLVISNKSDLTLDCNGAELNGFDKEFRQAVGVPYLTGKAPEDVGIRIISNETVFSQNITLKNCKLKNYLTGIAVLTGIGTQNHSDLKNNRNPAAIENYLRENTLKNVKIENTTIEYSHRNGIYIGRYITGLIFDNSSVKFTSGAGLYLESGTQRNIIKNSTFSENGHSLYDVHKRTRRRIQAKDAREGIAVDSSAKNTIKNNIFSKNSGGGIFIYKNCYEHHTDPASLPRYQSADNNLIKDNQFKDQKIGVWIASRQSKDLKAYNCGIARVATDTVRYGPVEETIYLYEDFAKANTVTSNSFVNVSKGVIVEDDNNIIHANTFSGSVTYDVKIGTKYRSEELFKVVDNTSVINNQFNSSTTTHIKLVYNPSNTLIKDNTP